MKKITVLAGGCFDVLHPGHIVFLEKAKKAGDYLVVLLESDKKIRKLKGKGRPVHSQKERAEILSALKSVDSVVCLPYMENDFKWHGTPPGITDMPGEPNKADQVKIALHDLRTLSGRIKSEHE